jgi:hypothetical protein
MTVSPLRVDSLDEQGSPDGSFQLPSSAEPLLVLELFSVSAAGDRADVDGVTWLIFCWGRDCSFLGSVL